MRKKIVVLLEKAKKHSETVAQNLAEVYKFIRKCEGLAPIE